MISQAIFHVAHQPYAPQIVEKNLSHPTLFSVSADPVFGLRSDRTDPVKLRQQLLSRAKI
jgi:hypothetical protein